MSWSDAFNAAEGRELLADLYDFEAKTAFAYVTIKTRLGMRGSLPYDERMLANMARCSRAWWRDRAWPMLEHLFVIRDGRLYSADGDRAREGGQPGDTDEQGLPAKPRYTKPSSVSASLAAQARWNKQRTAQKAAEAASDPHASRIHSASNPHMRTDADFMENQCFGHTEIHAEIMRSASDAHDSASARAPSLPLTDSVLSNPAVQLANQEESFREGERARTDASDAHDADSCDPHALARFGTNGPEDAPAYAEPAYKQRKRLAKEARDAANVPLPDDWRPSPDSIALARQLGHNVEVLAADFRDHYRDSGERRRNWDGTFSKWVRREVVYDRDKLKQRHLPPMGLPGGATGQPAQAIPSGIAGPRALEREPEGWPEFWQAYPQHDGGYGPARLAYSQALADGAQPLQLLEAVRRFRFREGRFIVHAVTWLRERRWLNKLEPELDPALVAAGVTREMLDQAARSSDDDPLTRLGIAGSRS